ncbi:hypothetical protein [Rhizobium rhizogenes]|uniref:hypothetical protein n=1 Tax=Rhizobium rhizogenes TaxID=359 RepID=UPI0022BDB9FF|nr:hypothetical protein [Rhizobium rhizogenes]MCZ7463530.1 hypothetical protein [Rhizobium rhizogenes]
MPNTIQAAGEAMPEKKHDIADLESPIADAVRMASIHARLLTNSISGTKNNVHLTNDQIEDILFSAYHIQEMIKKIYAQWEASI